MCFGRSRSAHPWISATGEFSWQPGVGFVGPYDFVFVRSIDARPASRQDVRIVLNPKSSGRVGPQVTIDTPTPYRNVGQPFVLAGWAVDLDDETGTGVDTVHVWAYPLAGGDPVFLGPATYGGVVPTSRRCMAIDSRTQVTV